MKKMLYNLVVFTFLVVFVCTGCSQGNVTKETAEATQTPVITSDKSTDEEPDEPEMVNGIYTKGYPISPEPITLEAICVNGSHMGDFNEMAFFDILADITNINLEIEDVKQGGQERISLMFATREYPDILLKGASTKQILDAAEAGDIIPLNNLIEQYSPNWSKIFDLHDYVSKVSTSADGNIYSLPFVRMSEGDSGVRDQWFINKTWLDSVGVDIPTTTDEFADALMAIKQGTGNGTIPEGATPWYFRFNQVVGGQLDIFGCFGGFIGRDDNSIYWIDDEVQFGWLDDHNVAAVEYLHQLYKDGLIPPEVFTDDWSAYVAKMSSETPVLGSFATYHIYSPDHYVAMAPPAAEGVKPKYRRQNNYASSGYFSLFADSENKEAAMRYIDLFADEDNSIQIMYGLYDVNLDKQEDGTITFIDTDNDKKIDVPCNFVPAAMTKDVLENVVWGGKQGIRSDNIKNIYSNYTVPIEWVTPPLIFSTVQQDRMTEISTDLFTYIDDAYANWIIEGGIAEDWEEFKTEVYNYGLQEYLDIYQASYDEFNKN